MATSPPPPTKQNAHPRLPSKLILTSTKAYFTPRRTIQYLESILDPSTGILPLLEAHRAEILFVLIPDFLTIWPCSQILSSRYPASRPGPDPSPPQEEEGGEGDGKGNDDMRTDSSPWPLALGAQNAFQSPSVPSYGPYTGEIVPAALSSLGCRIVELNHAERRRLLSETDDTAAEKASAVTRAGMIPLVCIGELAKPDFSSGGGGPLSAAVGLAMRELKPQIEGVLAAVARDCPVIFAYEPVWAIGAAEPAGVEYVGPVVQAIRGLLLLRRGGEEEEEEKGEQGGRERSRSFMVGVPGPGCGVEARMVGMAWGAMWMGCSWGGLLIASRVSRGIG